MNDFGNETSVKEFEERFLHHADELKWLYCELYRDNTDAYDRLVCLLRRAYEARPEAPFGV